MLRLLLADDDTELCALLRDYLADEGFALDICHDGVTALERATRDAYDLVILDIMMPGKSGLDVLRALRAQNQCPVLMLTARGDDVDSIVGLEMGADDYLAKPCNPKVLLARIRAILRRSEARPADSDLAPLPVGRLTVNPGARSVTLDGRALPLTSTEYSILEALVREAGHVVGKAELFERVLGRPMGRYDRALDMHISNLRHKLGGDGERIKTVRGSGYQYVI